ncbi:flavin reductase family protein [Kitasatospora sp. NBC_01266]|uniref:flavin reductase family protein n=1 Tax=Kitasatospora sp. NBC_01266 TaxID=2903572 RepID=UPI002E32682D|nr:flavin reductase family protein [Kitasatospora sp. NBC_01266]
MPVAPEDFTRAMARVPGPVVVATTVDPDGRRFGFTASSFSSLSMTPPLVLICLDKSASTHTAFTSADRFMINVLGQDQADVALRFARSGVDRFEAGDTSRLELGLPGIPEAAVRVACTLDRVIDGGDHSILLGRVESTHVGGQDPLLYCDRAFARPAQVDKAVAASGAR